MTTPNSFFIRQFGWLGAAALLFGSSLHSFGADAAVTNAAPAKNPWETTAAAGLTLTKGNSDTLLVTLGLETKRKWEKNEAAFGVAGGYGEDNNVKNNEFLNGFGQYNHLFTERFYGGLRIDGTYDGIANLDYRFTISPLAGYYFIKNTNTTLAVEIGPSAVLEKYQDQGQDNYFGIRFAERFEQKLSSTTKLWENASYVPQVDRWTEKYVITAEVGIDTTITKKWSLRLLFQDIYDSEPAAGRESNDMRLVAGTAYKF
jgi:putative salt-induced outer membrane protein YdiY